VMTNQKFCFEQRGKVRGWGGVCGWGGGGGGGPFMSMVTRGRMVEVKKGTQTIVEVKS